LIIKDATWQTARAEEGTWQGLTPLAQKAQTIETQGNLVKAEEVEDVLDTTSSRSGK
jgi:hypothetical protein